MAIDLTDKTTTDTDDVKSRSRKKRNIWNPFARFGKITQGKVPELLLKSNVESEITPADTMRGYVPPEDGEEQDHVKMVVKRFKEAAQHRYYNDLKWLRSLAYEHGNQWCYWSQGNQAQLASMADPNDPYANYVTFDMIEPIMLTMMARLTQSKPDVGVVAQGDLPINVQAADEERSILAHEDRRQAVQLQTIQHAHGALTNGASYGYVRWNPDVEVDVPEYDEDTGEQTGQKKSKQGAPELRIVPATSIYWDYKARSRDDANWIIHAELYSLQSIQEEYGDKGYDVKPGWDDQYQWFLQSYIAAISGDFSAVPSAEWRKNTVLKLICEERPSPRYPEGRRMVVAGGVLLDYTDMPEQHVDKSGRRAFSYIPFVCKETLNSCYPQGLVEKLIEPQTQYNKVWSKIIDRIDTDKLTLFVDFGSEIGVDAFSSPRNLQIIYKKPGRELTYQQPPPFNQAWLVILDKIWETMQTISGIHPVSQGQVSGGAGGALAIELLQQSDASQSATFSANIEQYMVERADWIIYLYRKYAAIDGAPSRLLQISDASNAQENAFRIQSFEGIKGGGRGQTYCTPGSAIPKSPSAQRQEVDQWYAQDLLGQKGMPSTIETYFKLIGDTRADDIVERAARSVAEALQAAQANQPSPMALAEQKAQMDLQTSNAMKQVDAQLYTEKVRIDTQAALTQLHAETQAKQLLANQNADAELVLALHNKSMPNVSLTGTMDPAAIESEEKRLGIAGDKSSIPAPVKPASTVKQGNPIGSGKVK